MMQMQSATWRNGSKTVTGEWKYLWSQDRFVIRLNSRDRITGRQREMIVSGDSPEWGNWKKVAEHD